MELSESEDISRYKNYVRKHLANVETLNGFLAPDFDLDSYPNQNEIDALKLYLDELNIYSIILYNAALLRQQHFENWIQDKREEDLGHKYWREGMNAIVLDSKEKLAYWSEIYNKLFTKAIKDYEKRRKPILVDITVRNVDFDYNQKLIKTVVSRPRLSDKEKNRRKKLRRKLIEKKRKAEGVLLDKASSINISIESRLNFFDLSTITIDLKILSQQIKISEDKYLPEFAKELRKNNGGELIAMTGEYISRLHGIFIFKESMNLINIDYIQNIADLYLFQLLDMGNESIYRNNEFLLLSKSKLFMEKSCRYIIDWFQKNLIMNKSKNKINILVPLMNVMSKFHDRWSIQDMESFCRREYINENIILKFIAYFSYSKFPYIMDLIRFFKAGLICSLDENLLSVYLYAKQKKSFEIPERSVYKNVRLYRTSNDVRTELIGEIAFLDNIFSEFSNEVVRCREINNSGGELYLPKEFCSVCCRMVDDILSCGECKSMKYCSKACQLKDWKIHKGMCPYIKDSFKT